MDNKQLSRLLVNELHRTRLFGEDEISNAEKMLDKHTNIFTDEIDKLKKVVDKKDTIISYILSYVSEKDMLVVEKGITEIENNL